MQASSSTSDWDKHFLVELAGAQLHCHIEMGIVHFLRPLNLKGLSAFVLVCTQVRMLCSDLPKLIIPTEETNWTTQYWFENALKCNALFGVKSYLIKCFAQCVSHSIQSDI